MPTAQETAKEYMAESIRLAERHRRAIKTNQDEVAGMQRLYAFIDEGLVDDQDTADKILAFLRERWAGYVSVKTIEHAVSAIRNQLKWSPLRAAVAQSQSTPAPPATPVISTSSEWKAGDPLPDDATEAQLRKSSIAEIKAWRDRQKALGNH